MTRQQTLFSAPQTEIGNDDWYTPKWIFDTLGLTFDLDVASPPTPVPWIPARHFYTAADDGLSQEWQGLIWMNPPFSKMTPWADRFREHGNGIALLPLTHNRWTQNIWTSEAAIHLLPSTLKFVKADGREMGIQFAPLLVAMGDQAIEALHKLGRVR